MKQLLVREVELAHALGYVEIAPFRRALKRGDIPAPNEYQGKSPVWYVVDLEQRYGAGFLDGPRGAEGDVLAAIEGV